MLSDKEFLEKKQGDIDFLESKNIILVEKDAWNTKVFLETILEIGKENNAKTIVYAWADCPFLQKDITDELIDLHEAAFTEYCFPEAFPYGLAPEILALDTIDILLGLEKLKNQEKNMNTASSNIIEEETEEKIGELIKRDFWFSLIKKDINSFEIETLISDIDMRTWRLSFAIDSKRNFISANALLKILEKNCFLNQNEGLKLCEIGQGKILENAIDISVLHSLPSFYAIQITSSCAGNCIFCPYPSAHFEKYKKTPIDAYTDNSAEFMKKEDFIKIIEKIAQFSEDAVVSLSFWGETLQHPELLFFIEEVLKRPKLSLLIETSDIKIDDDLLQNIKNIIEKAPLRKNNHKPIYWIVGLDARSSEMYAKLHGGNFSLEKAEQNFEKLQNYFPDSSYCQFLRIKENEDELEAFIRYWKEKTDKTIIQKYNNFSSYLDDKSVVDLSPLERNPCWHLGRDFHIFLDGSVPLCHSVVPYEKTEYNLGNILIDDIAILWEKKRKAFERHLKNDYQKICENCDEYYTFNF